MDTDPHRCDVPVVAGLGHRRDERCPMWPVAGTAARSAGPSHTELTAVLRDARETCGRACGGVRRPAPIED